MPITYQQKSGRTYALVSKSVRKGGKVIKTPATNLGLVLDKEQGIYQSRARGIFTYIPETDTYGEPPADFIPPTFTRRKNAKSVQEKRILDFGLAFVFDFLIKKFNLIDAINSIGYKCIDSFMSLLMYYMIKDRGNCQASNWISGNYASILYPKANITSQRISELLKDIGDEYKIQCFFKKYINILGKDLEGSTNILIDSTGIPNQVHFPLTAVSNHNGEISEEVRLIYVVQQKTRLPLYMRYIPGNIIDVSTIVATIKEIKAIGINTTSAILDAGYVSDESFDILYEEGISFISRLPSNRKLYKEALEIGLKDLEVANNIVLDDKKQLFNGRQVYVKRVELYWTSKTTKDTRKIYAYVCKDKQRQESARINAINSMFKNKKVNKEKIHNISQDSGIFVLISSENIKQNDILSHYYIREDIEQIFDTSKGYSSLTPLRVHSEETFRGHLLITFIATVVYQKLQNEIKNTKYSIPDILTTLEKHKIKVFDHTAIPQEATKEQNAIYKLLGATPQKEYPL